MKIALFTVLSLVFLGDSLTPLGSVVSEPLDDFDFFPRPLPYPTPSTNNNLKKSQPTMPKAKVNMSSIVKPSLLNTTQPWPLGTYEFEGSTAFTKIGSVLPAVSFEHVRLLLNISDSKSEFRSTVEQIKNSGNALYVHFSITSSLKRQYNETEQRLKNLIKRVERKWQAFDTLIERRDRRGLLDALFGGGSFGFLPLCRL